MADTLTKEKRSAVMAAIKSTGNRSTELKLVAIMRTYHITGWRRCQRIPGRPDFVFRAHRLAVFVDGCFWHGCPRHCRIPASASTYWQPKITRNKLRDRTVRRSLREQGWNVYRIWEHSLKDPRRIALALNAKIAALPRVTASQQTTSQELRTPSRYAR
jgi:DNA mismatch endonuclease (patch repair protein)